MKSNGLPPRLTPKSPSFFELRQGQNVLAFAYVVGGSWRVFAADIDSYFEETTRDDVPGRLYEAAVSLLRKSE
ncbi:hypothetical protein C5S53_04515 [Methanophagales archaeon]|nr:hypothetical protein C5S53_04515 [Methanophagales archaeon]